MRAGREGGREGEGGWVGGQSLQPPAQVLQSGPSRADFLCSYRLSLLFRVRSSGVFKWLLLQIYNCFNLTPRAQRNIFI